EWKEFFPYEVTFSTVRTCITMPPLPSVSLRARDLVWNALRTGRSYVANRGVGSDQGFEFTWKAPKGRSYQMGEDAPYDAHGRFSIVVPEEAEIVLRHNGQPYFWGTAKELSFPSASPGTYRVEVFLNRRMWIIS